MDAHDITLLIGSGLLTAVLLFMGERELRKDRARKDDR